MPKIKKNTDEDDFKIIEEFAELNRKEALLINQQTPLCKQ